jgi:hypothetical protein
VVNLLNRHEQIHSSLPREVRYLTDRFGILELNGRKPLYQQRTLQSVAKNIIGETLPFLGKSKLSIFESRMKDLWWERLGKKGKPRGLVQGISRDQLTAALDDFSSAYKKAPRDASRELYFALGAAQLKGKSVRYFADSTPINILSAHHLYEIFPEAKFINMIRDGRDTAFSVSKEQWGPSDPVAALIWWKERILAGQSALNQIPQSTSITLNLEDLVIHNRDESIRALLTFLHLQPSEALEKFFAETVDPAKMNAGSWKELSNATQFDKRYSEILKELADQGVEIKKFY